MPDATPEYCQESLRRAQAGLPMELTPCKKPSPSMTDGQTEVQRQIVGERFPGRQIETKRPSPPEECLLAIRPVANMWRWVLYDGCQIIAEGVPRNTEKGAHDDAEWMFEYVFYQSRIRRETRNHKPSEIAVMSDKELTLAEKFGTVRDLLKQAEQHIAAVLPKHLTPERMLKITESCVRRTPKLLDADPRSLIAAVVEASELGLDLGRQAHLIPFLDKKAKPARLVVQLIPDYKGLEDLAFRSGKVAAISAAVVYEKDEYEYTEGLNPTLNHTPTREPEKGKVIAAYAVATMTTTKDKPHAWLWREEIDKIREAAPSKNSPAWRNHFPEMAKKTAKKRLCKNLPISVVQRAASLQDQVDSDQPQRFALQFGPREVIDVGSEPSALDAPPPEPEAAPETTPEAEPPPSELDPEPAGEVDQQEESTNLCKALAARAKNAKTIKPAIMKLEREAVDHKATGGLYPDDYDTVMAACLARRTELDAAE